MTRQLNIKAFHWVVVPLSILIWVLFIFLVELGGRSRLECWLKNSHGNND